MPGHTLHRKDQCNKTCVKQSFLLETDTSLRNAAWACLTKPFLLESDTSFKNAIWWETK